MHPPCLMPPHSSSNPPNDTWRAAQPMIQSRRPRRLHCTPPPLPLRAPRTHSATTSSRSRTTCSCSRRRPRAVVTVGITLAAITASTNRTRDMTSQGRHQTPTRLRHLRSNNNLNRRSNERIETRWTRSSRDCSLLTHPLHKPVLLLLGSNCRKRNNVSRLLSTANSGRIKPLRPNPTRLTVRPSPPRRK